MQYIERNKLVYNRDFAFNGVGLFPTTEQRSHGKASQREEVKSTVNPRTDTTVAKQDRHEKVVRAFNSWSFKREQPDSPEQLNAVVRRSVLAGAPVSFVLYWGKGPRDEIAAADLQCINYLASLADRVRLAHAPGVRITLVFTDTHAKLNGHAREATLAYFSAVEEQARLSGFDACLLGDLVVAARICRGPEDITETPDPVIMRALRKSAARWYRGEGGTEIGALEYYKSNMAEKRAVELAFPQSIFITFNGSALRKLFPENMPVFYMYSLRRGVAVKPWFQDAYPGVRPIAVADGDRLSS